jgi:hypothetical protein
MVNGIVLLATQGRIAGESVVWTVPMVLECWRALLEYLAASLGADNVIPQAEVLVQKQRGFGNPLITVLTLYFVRTMCST